MKRKEKQKDDSVKIDLTDPSDIYYSKDLNVKLVDDLDTEEMDEGLLFINDKDLKDETELNIQRITVLCRQCKDMFGEKVVREKTIPLKSIVLKQFNKPENIPEVRAFIDTCDDYDYVEVIATCYYPDGSHEEFFRDAIDVADVRGLSRLKRFAGKVKDKAVNFVKDAVKGPIVTESLVEPSDKYIMTEAEYNAIDKVLTGTGMIDGFAVYQVGAEENAPMEERYDAFYDFEEDRIVPFVEGLSWINEGFDNTDNICGLTMEDAEALNGLFKRFLGIDSSNDMSWFGINESLNSDKWYKLNIYGGYNGNEKVSEDIEVYAKNEDEAKREALKIFKQDYDENYVKDLTSGGFPLKAVIIANESLSNNNVLIVPVVESFSDYLAPIQRQIAANAQDFNISRVSDREYPNNSDVKNWLKSDEYKANSLRSKALNTYNNYSSVNDTMNKVKDTYYKNNTWGKYNGNNSVHVSPEFSATTPEETYNKLRKRRDSLAKEYNSLRQPAVDADIQYKKSTLLPKLERDIKQAKLMINSTEESSTKERFTNELTSLQQKYDKVKKDIEMYDSGLESINK